jgi:hypothetical protein
MQNIKIERKLKNRAEWEKSIKELNVPYNNNNLTLILLMRRIW